jgi:Zn-dependent M28 family amino/carboxypeptidase
MNLFARGAGLVAVLGALLPLPAGAQSATQFTREAERAADLIDESVLRPVVAELADDRYGGRAPGSEGDAMTRAYLARALESYGFRPAAPGGAWEQPFELIGIDTMTPERWTFEGGGATVELAAGNDFVATNGRHAERASLDAAPLVYVGYGIEAPEYDWDDYKGVDVAGKVLLMLNNDPDWDPALFGGAQRLYYGRWSYKYEIAARRGAVGAIIIHTVPSAGYPWQVVRSSWSGEQFELPVGDEPRLDVAAWVTEAAAERLVSLAGGDLAALVEAAQSRDFVPVPLGVQTSLVLASALSSRQSANVLGILPGADPRLAAQAVVYTAHHDHLGVGLANPAGDPEDRIYNGARDNATGVSMVLAIARAFAALPEPPRRSILIAFVGAEEQGLLGSEYFAAHPTVHPGRMAANVNFDSGNLWGRTRDITFVGLGRSSLDAVAERVAAYQGRVVKPDQFPDRGYYYRSDQFNFAKLGVPAFYFKEGTEQIGRPPGWGAEQVNAYTALHYHQPSDELTDEWNWEGMVEDARFGFWAGLMVANDDDLPVWHPGDEFAAARRAALDSLR